MTEDPVGVWLEQGYSLATAQRYSRALPHARRLSAAMREMHEAGVQPTGRLLAKATGCYFGPAGLNGPDGKVFSATMAELGYVSRNHRWRKP